jgi:hypothetical protein
LQENVVIDRDAAALVTKAETRSDRLIEGHPFLAKPISFPDLIAGIEENLPVRALF